MKTILSLILLCSLQLNAQYAEKSDWVQDPKIRKQFYHLQDSIKSYSVHQEWWRSYKNPPIYPGVLFVDEDKPKRYTDYIRTDDMQKYAFTKSYEDVVGYTPFFIYLKRYGNVERISTLEWNILHDVDNQYPILQIQDFPLKHLIGYGITKKGEVFFVTQTISKLRLYLYSSVNAFLFRNTETFELDGPRNVPDALEFITSLPVQCIPEEKFPLLRSCLDMMYKEDKMFNAFEIE